MTLLEVTSVVNHYQQLRRYRFDRSDSLTRLGTIIRRDLTTHRRGNVSATPSLLSPSHLPQELTQHTTEQHRVMCISGNVGPEVYSGNDRGKFHKQKHQERYFLVAR